MSSFSVKLNKNILSRTATLLNQELKQLKSEIFIRNKKDYFNGKSLIGLLSNNLRFDDTIVITFTDKEEENEIKQIFDNYGQEVI